MNLCSVIIALTVVLLVFAYALASRLAQAAVLKVYGVRELPATQVPGLTAILRRLAHQAQVAEPILYLLRSGLPNSFALAGTSRGGTVVVTAGLLESLNETELAGILAHQIAFLKGKRVQLLTILAAYGLTLHRLRAGGATRLLDVKSARFKADGLGAHLMGESLPLIRALERIDRPVEWVASPRLVAATAHLFVCDPVPVESRLPGNRSHPVLADRIRELEMFSLRPLHSVAP